MSNKILNFTKELDLLLPVLLDPEFIDLMCEFNRKLYSKDFKEVYLTPSDGA